MAMGNTNEIEMYSEDRKDSSKCTTKPMAFSREKKFTALYSALILFSL